MQKFKRTEKYEEIEKGAEILMCMNMPDPCTAELSELQTRELLRVKRSNRSEGGEEKAPNKTSPPIWGQRFAGVWRAKGCKAPPIWEKRCPDDAWMHVDHPEPQLPAPPMPKRGGGRANPMSRTDDKIIRIKMGPAGQIDESNYKPEILTTMLAMKDFVEEMEKTERVTTTKAGVVQPVLGVYSITMHTDVYQAMAQELFEKTRSKPVRALQQLLCYMSMKSKTDKHTRMKTLTFSNQLMKSIHRLVPGGDCSGGKPDIVEVPYEEWNIVELPSAPPASP